MIKNFKFNEVVKYIKKNKIISRILLFTIALLISAIEFNLLERPAKIVTGGSTGLSIITEYLFGIKPSDLVLIVLILSLILSFIFLGLERTTGAIIATIIFPKFIDMTSNIGSYIHIEFNDMLVLVIFMGIISGISSGLMYKTGYNSGGLSVIFHILYKYFRISITASSFVINGILVFLGGFFFGWSKVMYALIVLYIYSIVADKVLLGTSRNKYVYIMTNKDDEVKDYVINQLNSGLTEVQVKGGFALKKRKVLMTVVSNSDYFALKEGIKLIDNHAFLIVTDSYQVSGGY